MSRAGNLVSTGLIDKIETEIKSRSIDVVVLDPMIKIGGHPENDNPAADYVCDLLNGVAQRQNVAIFLLHHNRKGTAEPGNMDTARGAGAVTAAARIGLTLTVMSAAEAKDMGVNEDDRVSLVRLDDGKRNLGKMSARAEWYKIVSINIDNGTDDYPSGDNIQAMERWYPPKTWEGLTSETLNYILDDIDAGLPNDERYSAASGARSRAAWKVVQKHAADKTESQCREVINSWVKSGLLIEEEYHSQKERRDVQGLTVDHSKRPP